MTLNTGYIYRDLNKTYLLLGFYTCRKIRLSGIRLQYEYRIIYHWLNWYESMIYFRLY